MTTPTATRIEARTAAALVIGNELLSGKVREANVAYLGRALRRLGIELRRVVVCPDEVDAIAADLEQLRRTHDIVLTSGGVGPTHDDLTLDGVARAFGCRRVRSEALEEMLRRALGDQLTTAHLAMADVPERAELVVLGAGRWPTVRVGNVFILPGVPKIFRAKVDDLAGVLDQGRPFVSRAFETDLDEGHLAPLLARVVAAHPEVAIGSYPRWRGGTVTVRVTVDGQDRAAVDAAHGDLSAALGAGARAVEEDAP